MSFDPEDFWKGEYLLECFEHLRDRSHRIRLDGIREGIVERTFDIRFSDTIIGRREAGAHEHLSKVWIEYSHLRYILCIVDIGRSPRLCDDFYRFFE